MARTNEKTKALAQLDFALENLSITEVADKYDVPRSTAQTWRDEIKYKIDAARATGAQRFIAEVAEYGSKLIQSFMSQLEVIADKDLTKTKLLDKGGSEDLLKMNAFHADRFGILVCLVRGVHNDAVEQAKEQESLPQ